MVDYFLRYALARFLYDRLQLRWNIRSAAIIALLLGAAGFIVLCVALSALAIGIIIWG